MENIDEQLFSAALLHASARVVRLERENAALRAAVKEMQLMLPVIEKAEDMGNGGVWATLTAGTGIATPNAYRYALEKALAKINENK